ncbi:MAG: rhomboid family intramembrane serine protease [marine benthic group bacterium]|jgi:membrane associated rhomboid family serine protease|nr:rhomboid family intramembrane serine protease [Gemmatimonadota bacterium]MCL7980906.1 rhomboid family intramembrane serine protease [Gemmatimonadota bacterium]
MGLWDRSYTGGPQRREGGGFGVGAGNGWSGAGRRDPFAALTPWVKRLLAINFAIWALMAIGLVPWSAARDLLAFSADRVLVRPWTFVTYMFVHAGFGHLFFNMLALFFFGPPLERTWGSRDFIRYYLVCGVGGSVAALLLVNLVGVAPMVGASAAIFGILLAFALTWPDAPIYLWFLLPIKAKYFVGFLALMTLYSTISSGRAAGGTAHWAHLGGLVAGWLWLRFGNRIGTSAGRAIGKARRARSGLKSVGKETKAGDAKRNQKRRSRSGASNDALDEVNRILDKIGERGMDSLTPAELDFLNEMSQQKSDPDLKH